MQAIREEADGGAGTLVMGCSRGGGFRSRSRSRAVGLGGCGRDRSWGWRLVEEDRTEAGAENGVCKEVEREGRTGDGGADNADCFRGRSIHNVEGIRTGCLSSYFHEHKRAVKTESAEKVQDMSLNLYTFHVRRIPRRITTHPFPHSIPFPCSAPYGRSTKIHSATRQPSIHRLSSGLAFQSAQGRRETCPIRAGGMRHPGQFDAVGLHPS